MTKRSISRRGALKLGAAATALPLVHIRTGHAAGKVVHRFLGPLGAWRQRRDAEAGGCLGAEEPGRGARRFHHQHRQQAAAYRRRRGAGEGRARRFGLLQLGCLQRRGRAGADGRCDAAADRQEWRGRSDLRIFGKGQRASGLRCRHHPARRPSRPARGSAGSSSTASICRRCIRRRKTTTRCRMRGPGTNSPSTPRQRRRTATRSRSAWAAASTPTRPTRTARCSSRSVPR